MITTTAVPMAQQPPEAVQVHCAVPTATTAHLQPHGRTRKVLKGLGATELALGCLSLLIGIVLCTYAARVGYAGGIRTSYGYNRYNSYTPYYYQSRIITIGEGIWCGIWMIVAGALGIAAGNKTASPCLINTHMAFSIVGSVASFTLLSNASAFAAVNSWDSYMVGYKSFLAVIGFVAFVLQIVSAVFCCKANPGCCGGCCGQYAATPGQPGVFVTTTTTTQPIPVSTAYPVQTQGYVVPQQQYMQPAAAVVQQAPPPSTVQHPSPGFQGSSEKMSMGQNLSDGGASSASQFGAGPPPYTNS